MLHYCHMTSCEVITVRHYFAFFNLIIQNWICKITFFVYLSCCKWKVKSSTEQSGIYYSLLYVLTLYVKTSNFCVPCILKICILGKHTVHIGLPCDHRCQYVLHTFGHVFYSSSSSPHTLCFRVHTKSSI